jgi:hypothetical protein
MICPRCQAAMTGDVVFCTNCGTRFGEPEQSAAGSANLTQPAQPWNTQAGQPGEPGQPGYSPPGQPGYSPPAHPGYAPQGPPSYGPGQPGYQQPAQPGFSRPGYAPHGPAAWGQPGRGGPAQPGYPLPGQSGYSQPGVNPPAYGAPGQPGWGQPGWGQPGHPPAARPTFAFDLKRLSGAEQVLGGACAVLIITLFLPWFGISGDGVSVTASGFSAHGYLVIALLTAIALLAYLVMRAGWDDPPVRLPVASAPLLLAGTGGQLLIVLIAFLVKPAFTGWQFGAYLGLIAALVACGAIALPALQSRQGSRPGS